MTDNANTEVHADITKLQELITFPATMTFKFIGNNNEAISHNVEVFFKEMLKLNASIISGNVSKKGTYITINVKCEVPNKDKLQEIYDKGPSVAEVLRVL